MIRTHMTERRRSQRPGRARNVMRASDGSRPASERGDPWGVLLLLLLLPGFALGAVPEAIPDDAIRLALERRLEADPSLPFHQLDVDVRDGVARVSGTVRRLRSRDRVTEIAETIRGVRSVVNTVAVHPRLNLTDEELTRRVSAALHRDPATDAYELSIAVEDGHVSLRGTVQSWAERLLAEQVVADVAGVTGVTNEIAISFAERRSDAEIEADIERRLEADAWVWDDRIAVEVHEGRVTLTGVVGSAAEKTRATLDAQVNGVQDVDAEGLVVEPGARNATKRSPGAVRVISDEMIERSVTEALSYDPRVAPFKTEVSVTGGIVTLRGTVGNLAAKRAAEEDAMNTIGVWRVRNHLKVRPVGKLEDSEIARRIRTALGDAASVTRSEIDVAVLDGKAFLMGTVNAAAERLHAQRVAERTRGVVDLENLIEVRQTSETKSDLELRQDVKSELWWSPFVEEDDISVSVEDGVVTLSGKVGHWPEHQVAEQNAREAGARGVRNRLEVRSVASPLPRRSGVQDEEAR